MGAFAGNRLGAIRDAKGKSVAAVFAELGGSQRAEVRRNAVWLFIPLTIMLSVFTDLARSRLEGVGFGFHLNPSGNGHYVSRWIGCRRVITWVVFGDFGLWYSTN
jgi:hypothetical protein